VHTHNLKTNLLGTENYVYQPVPVLLNPRPAITFQGFLRPDGQAGIRNEVWIVPTVGCVNGIGRQLEKATGALFLAHPFGCSQLGADLTVTQQLLKGLVNHPNAGGVLVLGLGCENNHLDAFRNVLGVTDPERVAFLNCQDCSDELAEGIRLITRLQEHVSHAVRQTLPASLLRVGLKCGGSDGFSGLTANPLVGYVSDQFLAMGGCAALTEVPEMFGAETILMSRAAEEQTFQKIVRLINGWKDYYLSYGQPVGENPSPGNQEGGITTLEEKSLGCVQKGGHGSVTDVITYGETISRPGLTLVDGPGNDLMALTNLTAAGCQVLLFTTGRGTPAGAPVPTVKIATNRAICEKKPGWFDFDASPVLEGVPMESLGEELLKTCLDVCSGRQTKNEQNGFREISLFKNGVVL